ncbi:MAG: methyltransferase family protein [Streptosporangiaceae bacterium]
MAHGAASTHILGALARSEIADHLAAGPRTLADLAAATGTEPDLLDRLLRATIAVGVLERSPGESVATTEVSSYLRTGPGSLRDLVLMLSSPASSARWST